MVFVVPTEHGTAVDNTELQKTTNVPASITNSSTTGKSHENGYTVPFYFSLERS